MSLLKQCQSITLSDCKTTESSLELGERFLRSGFLEHVQGTKRYQFALENRKAYLYIWDFYSTSDLLATICPPTEKFSFTCQFQNGQLTQPHVQDFVELAYVVKGELRQKILGKDIVFQEGELCLIDRNCEHQDYLFHNSSMVLFLCLRSDVLLEIMDENVTSNTIVAFLQAALMEQKELKQYIHFKPSGDAKKEMEECFQLLIKELREEKAGCSLIIKGAIMRICRLLSTNYEFQLSRQQKRDMNSAIFKEICHYIEKNCRTVTIQELSKVFHFQEDYFNRLIKKRTGKTYCELLQDVRLFKAEQLLTHSQMTISQIADEIGYKNKGYFYKLFEAKHGLTPAEYRKSL